MAIQCVLFDADGVIINSEMFSLQYQKKFGISMDIMLPFFKGVFQDCLVGKADLKDVIKPYLKIWKWVGNVDEFLQFWFEAEHNIDERIVNLIKALQSKGIKCYLATNQEKYRVEYMKKEMGFGTIFDYVFSSAEIGFKKPQLEFYEYVVDWLNKEDVITKDQIFYTDDSEESIEAATKFGIKSYLYRNYEEFSEEIRNLDFNLDRA